MTPLDENRIVATRTLDGIMPDGRRTRIIVSIATPYAEGYGFRCPLRVVGLDYDYTPPDMGGWDAVHSLLSAIGMAAFLLGEFIDRGGKVFYPDTDTPYDMSDFQVGSDTTQKT